METIERTIEVEGRKIMYDITGDGPPIVFVHGVWATGGIWYPVIDILAQRFRCINIHLPLGVHRYPSPKNVDHSPVALARVVGGVMDALDVREATLVGNDTGGAICQLHIATGAPRVAKLVLTNCDAYEIFPPKSLAPVYAMSKVPMLWSLAARLLRGAGIRRRFFATVAHTPPDPANLKMLMDRFSNDPAIREDLRLTVKTISPELTLQAAKTFANFTRPVLVLWGTDDIFFPLSLGQRLARAFPNATMQTVERAKLFVGLDQPDITARAIEQFAR